MVLVEIKDLKNFPKTGGISYFMNNRLEKNLKSKRDGELKKKDRDYVLIIDGVEGGGKTTFGFQIGKYVDSTLDLSRVCFNAETFKKAILKARPNQCVIYDEAITGLGSRASLSRVNRMLVSLMMQMRQKNLFVIVILPTFYLLDRYVAIFRASSLIHVYENRSNRGYFCVYNRKKKKYLYLKNRQTYTYSNVYTRFRGRFYGKFVLGDEDIENKYKKLKEKALQEYESTSKDEKNKFMIQRDELISYLYKKHKYSMQKLSDITKTWENPLSKQSISVICRKIQGKPDNVQ